MDPSSLIPDLNYQGMLLNLRDLAIAYALAFPIGWNREARGRSAGLRTFPLVAIAACAFIQAAERLTVDEPEALARIIEGVITGMGFIGGGAILKNHNEVHGTATAASLWATGAIGVAAGLQAFDVALAVALLTVATLAVLGRLKQQQND